MRQTLHQAKCAAGQKKARKAMQQTVAKTKRKQESVRRKLRKKTWGF
jgi:hypothetical protein